ncbi:hypothetical protein [uncultured Acinetobacter sp.]|uniref:hypothetical protein n=1 Tax=uncultured Acinetobacter sp. TaxID=165433 RepID=UPI00259081D0|nr:hypothetical protein [uncultured Acinetobacter sp.]
MLVKLNEDIFVNKDNITYVKIIRSTELAELEFHLVGGESFRIRINIEHPEYAASEILKDFGLN